jgi:para-aminobenzoate synthetase/4-amino-4-deoxychorismate lyase
VRFSARLDDLRPDRRRSAGFTDQVGSITAVTVGDVGPAIDEVERAVRRGVWAVGFIAYEAAPGFDPRLVVRDRDGDGLPLVWFGLYRTRVLNPEPEHDLGDYELTEWSWVDSREHFEADVSRIREHIIAGDTYQVNYTSRLQAGFDGDPLAFYHDLTAAQSGGYGTYLDTGWFHIVSASPELFFDRYPTGKGIDRLITRPMKGTIARGRWPEEDDLLCRRLAGSGKDQAENLIIVDLLRNDLGRVSRFGTVAVADLMAIERYDTVWQMTSTITGDVDAFLPLRDVLEGLFPCGSITGAPKVRTMQIIADLESSPRGVYTGAIGFIGPPDVPGPRASFSVGIRTVVIDGDTGRAEYGVGGGITFDSDPALEYAEATLKAEILRYGRSDFALLETMRWHPESGWYWLERHLGRLQRSAQYFAVDLDEQYVGDRLEKAVAGAGESRVRLTVDRRGRVEVEVSPLPAPGGDPVEVVVDLDPIDTASPFLFHKTTRRSVYDERKARHPGAGDVLLVNAAGQITESTIANVAVELDGRWVTPPVTSGCLPGIYRQVLLDEGTLEERAVEISDLNRCKGIALLNSVRLWRSAVLVDG